MNVLFLKPGRQARSNIRRRQIVEAALAVFTERGVTGAAMPEIAMRARASIGSIYHQFGSKDGVAAAVYLEGLRRYQGALVDALSRVRSARKAVTSMVEYHLEWVRTNTEWARYLSESRHTDFMRDHEEDIRLLNRDFGRGMEAVFRPHVRAGRLRPLPIDLFIAVVLGPCQEYVRGLLSGRAVSTIAQAKIILGRSAWRAVMSGQEPEKEE